MHGYSLRQGKTLKITKYIPRTKEHSSKGIVFSEVVFQFSSDPWMNFKKGTSFFSLLFLWRPYDAFSTYLLVILERRILLS